MMLRYIFKILSLRATTFFKKKFIFKILIKYYSLLIYPFSLSNVSFTRLLVAD